MCNDIHGFWLINDALVVCSVLRNFRLSSFIQTATTLLRDHVIAVSGSGTLSMGRVSEYSPGTRFAMQSHFSELSMTRTIKIELYRAGLHSESP